eukprot:TRINITY_DN998_c0_g1_i9.p1 TRINITY_DN998_c0_g1~~TRINITY_DN998_c0_g1_i9.p1  ORF type:complete len:172 (-),score=38.66 TRINITY_DN998_c0_g1_i9:201-716(-)
MPNNDNFRKQLDVDNVSYMLDILDTAGQEELSAMTDQYIVSGQGFLIVYSIQTKSSFNEVKKFHNKIILIKDEKRVPIVLIGNKCDLPPDMREVSTEEGKALAAELGCPFFETSAKDRTNVEAAFEEVVRVMRDMDKSSTTTTITTTSSATAQPAKTPARTQAPKRKCPIL